MLHTSFGICFNDICSIQSIFKNEQLVILEKLDFGNNPTHIYETTKHKKKKVFVIDGVESLKLLLDKFGNKLKGKFLVIDSYANLSIFNIPCIDCSNNNGYVSKVSLEDFKFDLFKNSSCVTYFENNEINDSFKTIKNLIAYITKKRKNKKVFKQTIQEVIKQVQLEVAGIFSKNTIEDANQKIGEVVVKCVTNFLPYEHIKKFTINALGVDYLIETKKAICLIRRFSETKGGIRTIRAFQDMMHYGTEKNEAINDNFADPFGLDTMLQFWNPSNSKEKIDFFENTEESGCGLFVEKKSTIISKRVIEIREKEKQVKNKTTLLKDFAPYKINKSITKRKTLLSKLGFENANVLGCIDDEKINLKDTNGLIILKENKAYHAKVT